MTIKELMEYGKNALKKANCQESSLKSRILTAHILEVS